MHVLNAEIARHIPYRCNVTIALTSIEIFMTRIHMFLAYSVLFLDGVVGRYQLHGRLFRLPPAYGINVGKCVLGVVRSKRLFSVE